MSSIKLKHSGGNSVSLNPPTSAPTSSEVAFKLPNADGTSGQFMKTDGSGNLAFATATAPTVTIARTNQTSDLSGSTNYDITLPANCYQVDFSALGVSTSGSGSPAFRYGTSGGIISTGSYYNIQGQFGAGTSGQYNSGDNHINFCNINMNGSGDVGEIQASFRMSGVNTKWTYNITTIRRTQTSGLQCIGYGDLSAALTTIRFFPYGTGFDSGFFSWTAYSTV